MKLIIAEKPNQANKIADALGGFTKKDGYHQSDKYYIAWCFGHMVELERDDKYREPGKWNKSYLPLIPQKYLYKIGSDSKGNIDSGKKKQMSVIKSLMDKSDEIINATDADREGELIFLYVYNYLKSTLPFKRLWVSTLTAGDIKKAFNNLIPAKEMQNLGKSATARAIADWLVGINGTQASTLQFGNGTLLSIGRVQTAILKIICERYLKNKNFQKSFTYRLRAEHLLNLPFYSESEIFEKQEEAQRVLSKLSKTHKCTSVEKSTSKKSPPLLFSIDTLIIEANKKYGYTGQETLDTAQSLYEKKLTSYPRTDSTYINEENFEEIKKFLPGIAKDILNFSFSFGSQKPKSVNDTKLTGSHDAIVPTGEKEGIASLSEKESNLFKMITARCCQSFSESAEYEKTKITFDNNFITFLTHASKLTSPGWKIFELTTKDADSESTEEEQQIDIKIKEGDLVTVESIEIKQIESKPPALYSEVNLTTDLTNFGKLLKEENPELLKEISSNIDISKLQIGTQATRPGIIELLKKRGFIEVKKNKFIPTEKGLKYYEIFKDLEVSNVVTTAIWEMKLNKVSQGEEDVSLFYKEIKSFTEKIVDDIFSRVSTVDFSTPKAELGKCPKCKKGNVFEGKQSYRCSEYKNGCDFSIWKMLASKKLSETVIKALVSNKETPLVKGFKSKAGKPFNSRLKLNKDFKIDFIFDK